MRRVIPLLCSLLLLCSCGAGPSASAPEDSSRLVIFTGRSAAVYDDAVREFERRTGIWVEVRTADGTLPLLEQIAAGSSGCDLLLGAAPDSLSAYGDCFAPYTAPLAADIPDAYRDSEDRWTPFSLLPTVLIYNDQLVQRNVPDSWADLVSVAWRGRIACPDPTVSATGCTALQALLQVLPGEEEAVLTAFSRNLSGVLPSAAAVADAVADGSCYVGVTTEDLALQAADSGLSITVVYPAGAPSSSRTAPPSSGTAPTRTTPGRSSTSCSAARCRPGWPGSSAVPYGAMRTPPCPRYCPTIPTAPAPIRRSCWPSGGA